MLKALRNPKVKKRVFIFIAVGTAFAFVPWGINLGEKGRGTAFTVGQIDGKNIDVREYTASYAAIDHQLRLMYGDKANDIKKFINVPGEAWDRLLLLREVKKKHITVSDDAVVEWLTTQPMFLTKDGFDKILYKHYINAALNIETRSFEEEVRQMLAMDTLRQKIREKISVSDAELRPLYDKERSVRDIAYAVIAADAANVQITEESLKKLEALKAKIDSDGFDKALTDAGLEIKTLEKFGKGTYVPGVGPSVSIEGKLSELKEGETSAAFRVPTGAAIVKLLKQYPTEDTEFEKEKEAFRKEMAEKKSEEKMRELLENLRGKLKQNYDVMKKLLPSLAE